MTFRVVRAEVLAIDVPTSVDPGDASESLATRPGVRVVVEGPDGVLGTADAAPMPGYSRESASESVDVATELAEALVGLRPSGLLEDAVRKAFERREPSRLAVPTAFFAVESALLHAWSLWASVAPWTLLGKRPHGARVGASVLLPSPPDGPAALRVLERARASGATRFKVKVDGGTDGALDDSLGRLVARLGSDERIRLDANGRLDPRAADRSLSRFVSMRPEYLEEPFPPVAWEAARTSPVPLAADESLSDPTVRRHLLGRSRPPALEVAIVKPALQGGLVGALRLAEEARDSGLDVVVTHMFDGPLGARGAAWVARALETPPRASALGAP
ncbi:MAG: enolase C-terminal domain-like protein [Polyangiaceae bacterium]